jgi:aspartyl-tRNA(Asn)/glutamyl-tRNA(Gln) amidotransferase subunit B
MKEAYEPTIGLEIHVELKTNTKMFCDSLNDPNEKHPNLNVCPVCMGHPGTLPTINQEAINKLISVGLALNCEIAEFSKFDRKNYFYPDLPKGYQISQYDMPLCKDGWLEIKSGETTKKIKLERIHMEEDTGRLMHPENADYSLVDYNRAGIPLMELVTKPDLKSGQDIESFAKELQLILRYLGASDADMEKGQMRVEVNISVAKKGAKELGTKVEVKNINSIRNASMAADYEFTRQSEALADGKEIRQETRGWDDTNQTTVSQRKKEGSADYRYFPEPDLPPMKFSKNQVEEMRLALPELPAGRRKRFKEQYGLNDSQIEIFTLARHLGNYFEQVTSELDDRGNKSKENYTKAANLLITELPPRLNMKGLEIDDLEGIKVSPESFAELAFLLASKTVTGPVGKVVLDEMIATGLHPDEIVKTKNLGQVSDTGELGKFVNDVIAKNQKAVEDYKNGKLESIKFLTGQVMALSRGKANPQVVSQLLEQKLRG